MMARRRLVAALTVVMAVLGLQLVVGVAPAFAAGSRLTFVTASPVQTAFGGNWNVQLAARFSDTTTVPIPADQATVDVYLSGIAAPIASRLPIQPDGSVYVSQSAAATLPPGEYQMTAQLVPVGGAYIEGTVTTTPLVLTISSYAVDARISVDDASVAAGEPVIEAELSGQFVDVTEAVPAGTWAITVSARGTTTIEEEVAQEAGEPNALRYAIPGKLDKGVDYTVEATFTPVESLAAGLEVTQPSKVTFHTPDGGLGDPLPYPLWLLIVTCLVPLALAATVIILTVQIAKRGGAAAAAAGAGTGPQPTAPTEEFVQVEDLFPLQQAAAPPAQYPTDTPTQVLPREPGAFTQLITPTPPAEPPQAPQAPQDVPTEQWSLSPDEDPDEQHLR